MNAKHDLAEALCQLLETKTLEKITVKDIVARCGVVVTNLDNGKQLPEYTIVGSQEANVMERKVSEDSPFGKALMGTKAGDEITVEAPRGVIHYRVDTIER